jgi:heme-degrading monooxygenase HmoA
MIAKTPEPPYYAVIFTTIRTAVDDGYVHTAKVMEKLVQKQPGFLGFESARGEIGITISYWKDLESIKSWKENALHSKARENGRKLWYGYYKLRIAKVERDYDFEKGE